MIIATSLARHLTIPLLLIVCFCHFPLTGLGQTKTHPYLGASMVSVQQRLSAPAQPLTRSSLESAIASLSSAYDTPIWIDRSVSRDRIVEAKIESDESFGTLLEKIATQVDASVLIAEGIVVIAPGNKAPVLQQTVWQLQLANLPSGWRRLQDEFGWPVGTPMRDVARMMSLRLGFRDDWIEPLEHDLWPAYQFSKVPKWSIAFCILSSMDRTMEWSDGTIRIGELPFDRANEQVEWTYTAKQIEDLGSSHCRAWKASCPTAVVERNSDGGWRIQALPEEHRQLVQPLVPKKKWTAPKPETATYSGVVQGRLGNAIQAIGQSLKIDFFPLPLPDAVASREIRVEYKNATAEQLLRDLGKAGGVEFIHREGRMEIRILP